MYWNTLLLLALVAFSQACSPSSPPIKSYVEKANENLIANLDAHNYRNYGLQFIQDYCPSQVPAATKFFDATTHTKALEKMTHVSMVMAKLRSNMLFEVHLNDAKHRDILCQVVIIEHSGRTRQSCPRQASQQALQRIMTINLDESNEASIGGYLLRKQPGGNGDGQPPTPPPFNKKKLPDDVIDYVDLTDDDKENQAANSNRAQGAEAYSDSSIFNVPVSRTASATSCESESSVVDIQIIDSSQSALQNVLSVAQVHFPISKFGGRAVPRDIVTENSLLYDDSGITYFQGIVANTPDYVNTCNIDSFLTHLLIMSNGDPLLAYKLFVTENSRIERDLAEIINRYWSGIRNRENPVTLSNDIKGMWVRAANLPYPKPRRNSPVNLYGSEFQNVYDPLVENTLITTTIICKTNLQDLITGAQTANEIKVKNRLLPRFSSASQIMEYLGLTSTDFLVPQTVTGANCCTDCANQQASEIRYSFVADTTWVLNFECPLNVFTSFDVENLPHNIYIADAFRTQNNQFNDLVDFGLGYLSYTTQNQLTDRNDDLYHQISFHFVNGEWFLYDDASNDGRLSYLGTVDAVQEMIQHEQLSFASVTYFRKKFYNEQSNVTPLPQVLTPRSRYKM